MSWAPGLDWNHNDYYHPFMLRQVPDGAQRALDVACGTGAFARKLATRVASVEAIDLDAPALSLARGRSAGFENIAYREADLLRADLGAYDFISCITAIHHMPFEQALAAMRDALAPGGVLAVLGLARATGWTFAYNALTLPLDVAFGIRYRATRHPLNGLGVEAPVKDPEMTGAEVRAAARTALPTVRFRQHLFYRYSLVYRRRP